MADIRVHHVALLSAAGVAGLLLWQMGKTHPTGGFDQPPRQPAPDDDLARITRYHPVCQPGEMDGYRYTAHRFPRVTGGEITAAIHRGWSPMRIPQEQDVQWLIAPPSEVTF